MLRPVLGLFFSAAVIAQTPPPYIEGERTAYNEIYEKKPQFFTREPNEFLVRTIQGRKPGRALDVAMGQGRNAIWLASQGWQVTGFDVSDSAVKEAKERAAKLGLELTALVTPYEQFDWGKDRWDLIVFSYFLPQSALPKAWESLRAGGLVVVEGFHVDTAQIRPIGGGYHNNELLRVFEQYRILKYEDVEDRQDWGRQFGETNRLVRVLAQKPGPAISGCSWESKSYSTGEAMCWGTAKWTCGAEGWEFSGKCTDGK